MIWVTREKPKIDRIACPWLITRFIDRNPEFLFVPKDQVRRIARGKDGIPYDIPGVELTHAGELCSFDAFLKYYKLNDPPLHALAKIVRAADTDTLKNSPEAPGLIAITLGLSANFQDDHEMLKYGIVIYDALFTWCKSHIGEKHDWYPEMIVKNGITSKL